MNYPKSIQDYFFQKRIEPNDTFFMIVSLDGVILDAGTLVKILNIIPVIGEPVDGFIWALTDRFPISQNLFLPNIQLNPTHQYNLHLLVESELVWIIVHETAEKSSKQNDGTDPLSQSQNHCRKVLNGLDYLVFYRLPEGKCALICHVPDWAKEFIPTDHVGHICAPDLFPFIKGFEELIPAYQPGTKMVKKYAGMWPQTKPGGGELMLQAWALLQKDEAYLVVSPVEQGVISSAPAQLAGEHILAYEQLQKSQTRLQELAKLNGQFVGAISHDFRSPISTLIDGISYLQDEFKLSTKIGDYELAIIDQVKMELIRLLEYNNKLYDWAQLNHGTLELNIESIPVKMILESVKGQINERLHSRQIKLTLTYLDEAIVNTDFVLICQAVYNLIDNAIQFSRDRGAIVVEASCKSIKISDQGLGMSSETIKAIKKGGFVQVKKGSNVKKGTGLGLAIVSRIMEILNLRLEIDSVEGEGTQTTILFY